MGLATHLGNHHFQTLVERIPGFAAVAFHFIGDDEPKGINVHFNDTDLRRVRRLNRFEKPAKVAANLGHQLITEAAALSLDVMGDLEKQIVMDALSKTSGVQVRAAKHLGITERSLWHLVKKHSIEVEKFK